MRIHEPVDLRLAIAVADGLSASAAAHHAIPLLMQLRVRLTNWSLDAVIIATQARVAILIGERPGLSSPDNLGIYMT